jgi:hypothetical protein
MFSRKQANVLPAVEEEKTQKGKAVKFRKTPKKRAKPQPSGAPPENEYILFPQRNRGAMGVYCEVADT